ncbi:CheR family methyltransferase [Qipengyuania sediminis]|uniref:CheR family methyltransferase n=1 Tax=Qipengyuania sediminis TaxID=1532023 RepID=UPI0010598935|nr:protein-glutamate O-methyltransferase CheR [Qipengyuania sediminis]
MALSDASHRIIADLLASRTGQELSESRLWRVPSALSPIFRERGISNVDQLVCLLAGPGEKKLAGEVVEALLNNETYFFRDHAYFATLAHQVLPELVRARAATRRLTIWSAGCSTGQEVLSLAMMFAEQPARWSGWHIDILGTDISGKAIATAKSGRYTQFEIQRGISVAQMLNFFTECPGGGWQAADRIRGLARYQQHNILDPVPSPGRFDLILCRNVLLYFNIATRQRVFDRMSDALAPDGWLMLGAGETVAGQTERFAPAACGSALYRHADTAHGAMPQSLAVGY